MEKRRSKVYVSGKAFCIIRFQDTILIIHTGWNTKWQPRKCKSWNTKVIICSESCLINFIVPVCTIVTKQWLLVFRTILIDNIYKFVCVQHIRSLGLGCNGIGRLERDLNITPASLFGCYDDDAVGCSWSINSSGWSIFQHGHTLYVVRIYKA